ncbi:unnamed protein product [Calypogeia fissa]
MTQTRSQTAQQELSRAQETVWVEVEVSEELRRRSFGEQQGAHISEGPSEDSSIDTGSEEVGASPEPQQSQSTRTLVVMVDRLEDQGPRPVRGRSAQRARFQYKSFKGKDKKDPDEWLEDFVGTAKANGEEEIMLTILAGVLKGEARPWYNGLPDNIKQDWDRFRTYFLNEFRPRGISDKALIKIGEISMGKKESLRKFLQKFNSVICKISTEPTDGMKKAWFINALPKKMQFWVKNQKPHDFEQAFFFADSYIDAKASEKSKKKKKDKDKEESEESEDSEEEKEEKEEEEIQRGGVVIFFVF